LGHRGESASQSGRGDQAKDQGLHGRSSCQHLRPVIDRVAGVASLTCTEAEA
jgi:hypothetical protein